MRGTCMDARGLVPDDMVEGAARAATDKRAEVALATDRVLVF